MVSRMRFPVLFHEKYFFIEFFFFLQDFPATCIKDKYFKTAESLELMLIDVMYLVTDGIRQRVLQVQREE